jgi:hypothetical protein
MGQIDVESISQWGGDVLTLSASSGCVGNDNVRYTFSSRFANPTDSMKAIPTNDTTAKLVMPMFFSTGKVDLMVSFDSGNS